MAYKVQAPHSGDAQAIAAWAYREFQKLEQGFFDLPGLGFAVQHNEPAKPRQGMIVYADGSDWDPGEGEGLYGYFSSGWIKLQDIPFIETPQVYPPLWSYETLEDLENASPDDAIKEVFILAHTTLGDVPEPMHFRKVGSEPSHAGKVEDADGGWWEFCGTRIWPQMRGAPVNGVDDDFDAIMEAHDIAFALKIPLRFTADVYNSEQFDSTVLLRPMWEGAGSVSTVILCSNNTGICLLLTGADGESGGYISKLTLWAPSGIRSTGQGIALDGNATHQPDGFYSFDVRITGDGTWDICLVCNGTDRPGGGATVQGLREIVFEDFFAGRDVTLGVYLDNVVQPKFNGKGIYGGTSNGLQVTGNSTTKRSADIMISNFKVNGLLNIIHAVGGKISGGFGSVSLDTDVDQVAVIGYTSGSITDIGTNNNTAALA